MAAVLKAAVPSYTRASNKRWTSLLLNVFGNHGGTVLYKITLQINEI
jgi:hypothetical protein